MYYLTKRYFKSEEYTEIETDNSFIFSKIINNRQLNVVILKVRKQTLYCERRRINGNYISIGNVRNIKEFKQLILPLLN